MILGTADMTLEASLFVFVSSFMRIFVALILLAAGFAFLSSYGFLKNNRIVGLIASLVSAIFILVIFKFSIVSIFLSLGLVIACMLIISLANTYGKELKRWILFRTGSHSISTALLIVNLMLALGIFLAISIDADYYQNAIKEDFSATMEEIAIAELSSSGEVTEEQRGLLREQIEQRTDDFFSNSLMIGSFAKFLPIIVAFTAWAFLELLRMLVLPNIGGMITYVLIRISRRK